MAVTKGVTRITEQRNPLTMDIDLLNTGEILGLINDEDAKVAAAIRAVLPAITQAVDLIAARMKAGGRLFYIGAGTSATFDQTFGFQVAQRPANCRA